MSFDSKKLKETLVAAGLEVYRTRPDELHVAERVRSHLMDSGIRIAKSAEGFEVRFIARTQRSDYPGAAPDLLFARIRERVGVPALANGFAETSSGATDVKDPMDAARTLDVWQEVSYARGVASVDEAIDAVRWALGIDRFVLPG